MRSILFLLCVALGQQQAVLGAATEAINSAGLKLLEDQDCGVTRATSARSEGEVTPGSRPWMVLFDKRREDGQHMYSCSGTLITDRYVLTVAHCFRVETLTVHLGEHDQSTDPDCTTVDGRKECQPPIVEVGIEKIIMHPEYNYFPNISNDIALVKLDKSIDFNDNIRPICLPLNADLQQKETTLKNMLNTGWGVDNDDSSTLNLLRESELAIADRDQCNRELLQHELGDNQICAYMNGILCHGTSGAPLSSSLEYKGKQRFVQFGTMSFGIRGCTKTTPVVSTRVASYLPWITKVINEQ